MTYVETIKRGNKLYYYLTKNIRIAHNKWKKIRIYLGDKPPSQNHIKKYTQTIEKKIQQQKLIPPPFSYLTREDAETLQDLKESYKAWLQHTPESVQKKLYNDFVIRFTYHTNAIEGNRLTLRQTALILKDKVIPSGILAEDYNEAINGRECLTFLKNSRGDFAVTLLRKINTILTKNTGVHYVGQIRFFDVHIEGSTHMPPKHQDVKKHLLNLMKWYSANKNKLHPFELATMLHSKIAWIHPFEDGNGRTARAIMNYILLKKGYPMFYIPYERRGAYYAALEKADNGDYKSYVKQMLQLVIEQIRSYGHKAKK